MIIELPYTPTKFRRASIMSYFIDNTSIDDHELMPNNSAPTQVSRREIPSTDVLPAELPTVKAPLSS